MSLRGERRQKWNGVSTHTKIENPDRVVSWIRILVHRVRNEAAGDIHVTVIWIINCSAMRPTVGMIRRIIEKKVKDRKWVPGPRTLDSDLSSASNLSPNICC